MSSASKQAQRASKQAQRVARRAAGLCPECGSAPEADRVMCARCGAKAREALQRRRERRRAASGCLGHPPGVKSPHKQRQAAPRVRAIALVVERFTRSLGLREVARDEGLPLAPPSVRQILPAPPDAPKLIDKLPSTAGPCAHASSLGRGQPALELAQGHPSVMRHGPHDSRSAEGRGDRCASLARMILPRFWSIQNRITTDAGAQCSRCNVAAQLEPDASAPRRFHYCCPSCGELGTLCPLVGGKGCVLPAGHGGRCQSKSGSSWHGETREAFEARQAQRRALDPAPSRRCLPPKGVPGLPRLRVRSPSAEATF